MSNHITVSGTGIATAPPDQAVLSLGVAVSARTVAAAASKAAVAAGELVAALQDGNVAAADISTTNYSIQPDNDHRDGRQLRGYRVTNMVEVQIRDLTTIGHLVGAATAAAGDSAVINGIQFGHQDARALEAAARADAWEDAERKASQLAELAGKQLGSAREISEQAPTAPGTPARALATESAFPPIAGGESSVAVTISVEFEMA